MSADTKLFNLATTIATTKGCSWAEATREAGLRLKDDEVLAYRGVSDEETPAEQPTTAAPVAESARAMVGRAILEKKKLGLSDEAAAEAAFAELMSPRPADAVHLRRLPGERFSQMVNRVERERNLSTRDAMRLCSEQFPQLAESWANGTDLVAAR